MTTWIFIYLLQALSFCPHKISAYFTDTSFSSRSTWKKSLLNLFSPALPSHIPFLSHYDCHLPLAFHLICNFSIIFNALCINNLSLYLADSFCIRSQSYELSHLSTSLKFVSMISLSHILISTMLFYVALTNTIFPYSDPFRMCLQGLFYPITLTV